VDSTFDLIGIGECLIELYEQAPHTYRQSVAGDVFNTLFYASRLGLRTGFISNFGSDTLTQHILDRMDAERIDRSCTATSQEKTNGLYLISQDEKKEPKYSFWRNDSAARQTLRVLAKDRLEKYISQTRYFHFSAIALAILQQREILIAILQKLQNKILISFDTNFRHGLWDDVGTLRNFIEENSSLITYLFVSKNDDEHLYGKRPADEAVLFYTGLGYKTVIFRQGENDVLVHTADGLLRVPTVNANSVVDTTAAGDAFNAGFIASQLRGESIEDSILSGNRCAAFVIGRHGALADDFGK
jgi:2-dehydro-3-deoxygluconokinase